MLELFFYFFETIGEIDSELLRISSVLLKGFLNEFIPKGSIFFFKQFYLWPFLKLIKVNVIWNVQCCRVAKVYELSGRRFHWKRFLDLESLTFRPWTILGTQTLKFLERFRLSCFYRLVHFQFRRNRILFFKIYMLDFILTLHCGITNY